MQWGRFLSFAFFILIGGLLQLWALIMMLNANGQSVTMTEVLGDGGLFFFATSITIGSAISLFDHHPMKVGKMDFNVTIIILALILVPVLIYYSAVLSSIATIMSAHAEALTKFQLLVANGEVAGIHNDSDISKMLNDAEFVGILVNPKPFGEPKFISLQVACATLAISYWIYSGNRTGLFVKQDYDVD